MRGVALLAVAAFGCGRLGFEAMGGGVGDPDAMAVPGDARVPDGDAAGARFTKLPATGAPTARRSTSAALDAGGASERLWIFGGFGSSGFRDDLHVHDAASNAWTLVAATGTPSARERHVLAWDPADAALVMFGGQFSNGLGFVHYDDLFVLRSATSAWIQIPRSGAWPAPRKDAALVYVPHLDRFLLFGGNDGTGAGTRFNDLWSLTLDAAAGTATWVKLVPGGVAAPAVSAGCVVYDPSGRRLFVFGGEIEDGVTADTTYQYLVDGNAWQLDTTTGPTPPGASFHQCAWDPARSRIIVYGGQAPSGAPLDGTHTYAPATRTWSMIATEAGSPVPGGRADGGAIYSPSRGGLIWFGGRTGLATYTNETWLLDVP